MIHHIFCSWPRPTLKIGYLWSVWFVTNFALDLCNLFKSFADSDIPNWWKTFQPSSLYLEIGVNFCQGPHNTSLSVSHTKSRLLKCLFLNRFVAFWKDLIEHMFWTSKITDFCTGQNYYCLHHLVIEKCSRLSKYEKSNVCQKPCCPKSDNQCRLAVL